jgi:electron transport complex protein RnfG
VGELNLGQEILRPGLVLCLIATVAAVCLGLVHTITKEPIAREQARLTAEALVELLPEAKAFKEDTGLPHTGTVTAVTVGHGDEGPAGVVIQVAPKGFSDKIELLVAITGGTVRGIKILKQTETPGLGANAAGPAFGAQYVGKGGALTVTKGTPAADEIQAITSATITSQAVTDGVNEALAYYAQHF